MFTLNFGQQLEIMKLSVAKILLLLFLFMGFFSKAQTTGDFEHDFQQLVLTGYPPSEVDSLFKKYNHILFFFNSNSTAAATITGKETSAYPLASFKSNDLYQKNIDLLLQDTAFNKNSLGYFIAAAANDRLKIPQITSILVKNGYKDFWAANVLMVLKTKDISPIVKTIVNFQDKDGVTYLIEPFVHLDNDVIEPFVVDSIKSKDLFIQYLAIRAMAKGKFSGEKESLLRNVAANGADGLKGWAISALSSFNAPNMLDLVQPYLDNKDLNAVALRAIANSTSIKDGQYLDDLLKRDSVNTALLMALAESDREETLRKWLKALRDRGVPKDYYAFIDRKSIVYSEVYFDEVCETIRKTKNQKQIYPLYDYFAGRKDEKSIQFLIECLSKRDQDTMVKYAIVKNLRGKKSDLLKQALPAIMKNADISDIQLVYLLIEYKNNDYRDLISKWLNTGEVESAYRTLCNSYLNL